MTVPYDYEGRARRRCPTCDVEIDVIRPQRPIGKDSTRPARHAYATELRRQVLWEATCPDCRAWWNAVINRADRGFEPTSDTHSPAISQATQPRR
jgi:hypothetical protein